MEFLMVYNVGKQN